MNHQTAEKIVQQIRYFRGVVTIDMRWSQGQPDSSTKIEKIEEVAFWRDVLNYAERRIKQLPVHYPPGSSADRDRVTG